MNSFIVSPSADRSSSTSAYTVLQSRSGRLLPFGSTYKSSSSWRKFIPRPAQRQELEIVLTVIPAERTTTEGPIVLKAAPLPEDYDARVEEFLHFLDELEAGAYAADDITTEQ